MTGMIIVNINPAYRADELKYTLNKAQCEALLMITSIKTTNYDDLIKQLVPEVQTCEPGKLTSRDVPALKYIIKMDNNVSQSRAFMPISEVYAVGDTKDAYLGLDNAQEKISPEDICSIYFTSGTTGFPKAACLSHFSILNNGWMLSENLNYSCNDKVLCPLPLYHCSGSIVCALAALTNGAELLFPSALFDPEIALKVCVEKKVTSINGVPTMFMAFLKLVKQSPEDYNLSSLRTGTVGGSLCTKPVKKYH